jgi:hypothetical protein
MTAPTAWRVRCYDSKGRVQMDRTQYEPLPEYERINLDHHFAVHVEAYALVPDASQPASTANFIATQADRAGEVSFLLIGGAA